MDKIEKIAVLKVKSFLDEAGIEYNYSEHDPTPTSEDSARIRGTELSEGIKALVLRGKKTGIHFMFCIPSNLKMDAKTAKGVVGESVSFEKPEILKEEYGLIIGGVPPLGEVFGIKTFLDKKILDVEKVAFNCGSPSASIVMGVKEFENACEDCEWGEFSK